MNSNRPTPLFLSLFMDVALFCLLWAVVQLNPKSSFLIEQAGHCSSQSDLLLPISKAYNLSFSHHHLLHRPLWFSHPLHTELIYPSIHLSKSTLVESVNSQAVSTDKESSHSSWLTDDGAVIPHLVRILNTCADICGDATSQPVSLKLKNSFHTQTTVMHTIYIKFEMHKTNLQQGTDRQTDEGHPSPAEARWFIINDAGLSQESCGVAATHHLPLMK